MLWFPSDSQVLGYNVFSQRAVVDPVELEFKQCSFAPVWPNLACLLAHDIWASPRLSGMLLSPGSFRPRCRRCEPTKPVFYPPSFQWSQPLLTWTLVHLRTHIAPTIPLPLRLHVKQKIPLIRHRNFFLALYSIRMYTSTEILFPVKE